MNVLTSVDAYILAWFEKWSDAAQSYFGVNSFWIARLFIGLMMISVCLQIYLAATFLFLIPNVLMLCMSNSHVRVGERESGLSGESTCKNPLAFRSCMIRSRLSALFILLLCPGAVLLYTDLLPVNYAHWRLPATLMLYQWMPDVCVRYLCACTPKPPSKSKLKKLTESAISFFKHLSPQPQPA